MPRHEPLLTHARSLANDLLWDGDVHHVRLLRLECDAPRVIFDGRLPLYVERRPQDDRVCVITVRDRDWAEGSLSDVDRSYPDGCLAVLVEDWLLEFPDIVVAADG